MQQKLQNNHSKSRNIYTTLNKNAYKLKYHITDIWTKNETCKSETHLENLHTHTEAHKYACYHAQTHECAQAELASKVVVHGRC